MVGCLFHTQKMAVQLRPKTNCIFIFDLFTYNSLLLFFFSIFGFVGLLMSSHLLIILVYIDLLILYVITWAAVFSTQFFSADALIFFMILFVIAAVETIIGTTLFLLFYQFTGRLSLDFLKALKY